jgi:glycosyltransferase involved in cell wall biosynthesis
VRGKREGVVDGIKVVEFEIDYSNYLSFARRTLVFLKYALRSVGIALTRPCDLIFATSTPLTAVIPGIFARWLKGKRFVFEVRDLWPELPREMGVITNPLILGMMSFLEWISYNSANACIGLSPGIVEGIERRCRPGKPVAMIPNGCDLELFDSIVCEPLRPEGVKENDLMAIFTGAHGMANGLDAVLRAAEVLQQRGRQDIKLVFIGDGKLKPGLMETAALKKLENCIFLDPVPKKRLLGYMRGADLGLMILANVPAFYYGTSPNKFFDYLAVGLPVLNNYPGWLAEMITEHQCGYAIAADNPEAFADALEDAADNRERLKTMGNNARRLGETEFARNKLAARFVEWLEKVK